MDVLIVGAGPTGLTLACDLARQGIDFRIVEQHPEPPAGSRAFGIKPQTLAVFDDLGIAPTIAAEAALGRRQRFHLGPRRLFDLDLRPARATIEQPYPNLLMLPQWRTEAVLRDRLAELGGKVEFGTTVTAVELRPDGVTATLDDTETVSARYLVGADGGRSTVRRELGIEFTGRTDTARAMLADARLDGLDPALGVHLWTTAGGHMIAARPVQDGGLWQVVVSLPAGTEAGPDTLHDALATRAGRPDVRVTDVAWLSEWRYNLRMASRYRRGRAFLAGDAAHVHSPAGGHGMNTGVQDAYNLGWKLGLVLRGAVPGSLLDTYEAERMPVARAILADSDRQFGRLRGARIPRPLLARMMKVNLVRLHRRARNDHPVYPPGPLIGAGGGQPAPDGRTPTGARLFDLFRGSHFSVLAPHAVPGLDSDFVRVHRTGSAAAYTIVRPDGYTALAASGPAPVVDYFNRLKAG
ncbi:FAD-dependent monooxygenase [Actinoplanes sp. NPDC049681]|uniref:FAD-dependent monooxygenase n=1 Tax=Actinoplanes sp. NPDC049681 TaxID=3363905 RepID=UPI0037A1DE6F